ncbi:hypothetical protein, partial [Pseudovibrio flavus]|uniref:hypothetical protein n=1 Tax=Pseudovibrio flavus TaxID=2529854 RepID=UPI00211CBDF6
MNAEFPVFEVFWTMNFKRFLLYTFLALPLALSPSLLATTETAVASEGASEPDSDEPNDNGGGNG